MFQQAASHDAETTISFEIFPPRTPEEHQTLLRGIELLSLHKPSFISITDKPSHNFKQTIDLAVRIKSLVQCPVILHLTCTNKSKNSILRILDLAHAAHIEHLLILRGDTRSEQSNSQEFHYAIDAIRFLREIQAPFILGAACYPEGHADSQDAHTDLKHLKDKVDAGTDFLISQLFFETEVFTQFLRQTKDIGISIPIIPGLLPLAHSTQLQRVTQWGHIHIPSQLKDHFTQDVGLAHFQKQYRELSQSHIPNIHLFTMNKWDALHTILGTLHL